MFVADERIWKWVWENNDLHYELEVSGGRASGAGHVACLAAGAVLRRAACCGAGPHSAASRSPVDVGHAAGPTAGALLVCLQRTSAGEHCLLPWPAWSELENCEELPKIVW